MGKVVPWQDGYSAVLCKCGEEGADAGIEGGDVIAAAVMIENWGGGRARDEEATLPPKSANYGDMNS